MIKESFETKLYNPRDAEGNPNTETLDLIREIEEKFKDNPAFVGIIPKGSKFHGYSKSYSDIDIMVLFDSSKIEKESDDNSFSTGYALDKDKPVHFFYRDINLDEILSNLESDPDFVTIAILTERGTGEKINFYRDKIGEKLKELPINNLNQIKKRALDYLMGKEGYSIGKAANRIADLKNSQQEVLDARRKLWNDRFDAVWHI